MVVGCAEGAGVGYGVGAGLGTKDGTGVGSWQTASVALSQLVDGAATHSEALVAPQQEKGAGEGQVEQAPLSKSAGKAEAHPEQESVPEPLAKVPPGQELRTLKEPELL